MDQIRNSLYKLSQNIVIIQVDSKDGLLMLLDWLPRELLNTIQENISTSLDANNVKIDKLSKQIAI